MGSLPSLFCSFLPLANPIGFGFQDFIELGVALVLMAISFVRVRPFVQLLIATVAAHLLLTWWTDALLTPATTKPQPEKPPVLKKPVSPFEDVK